MTALFVPQVLNEEALRRAGERSAWTPYVRNDALGALMAGVCEADERQCQFVAEPLGATWTNDDFVDEGHFSRGGGEKLASILAKRIRPLEPVPPVQ